MLPEYDDSNDFVNEMLEIAMNPEYENTDVLPVLLDDEEIPLITK